MSTLQSSKSSQVKVTIPMELKKIVQNKAELYGLTLSTYIKHLMIEDVKDKDIPQYKMSERAEKLALKTLDEHKKGKTHEINDIEEFINGL